MSTRLQDKLNLIKTAIHKFVKVMRKFVPKVPVRPPLRNQ